jgi:hypothetical protein
LIAQAQYFFVAGSLAFFDEPRSDPPDQRVEPEDRFDDHVNRCVEIVPAFDVAEFVRENRLQFGWCEAFDDSFGQEESGAQ